MCLGPRAIKFPHNPLQHIQMICGSVCVCVCKCVGCQRNVWLLIGMWIHFSLFLKVEIGREKKKRTEYKEPFFFYK